MIDTSAEPPLPALALQFRLLVDQVLLAVFSLAFRLLLKSPFRFALADHPRNSPRALLGQITSVLGGPCFPW